MAGLRIEEEKHPPSSNETLQSYRGVKDFDYIIDKLI